MKEIDTGGPAFPTENARQTGPNSWHEEGMTLRDYFASKALQGLLKLTDPYEEAHWNILASDAYKMADAMLKARNA